MREKVSFIIQFQILVNHSPKICFGAVVFNHSSVKAEVLLEETFDLASFGIDVDPAVGWIGSRTRHQGD